MLQAAIKELNQELHLSLKHDASTFGYNKQQCAELLEAKLSYTIRMEGDREQLREFIKCGRGIMVLPCCLLWGEDL